MGSPPTRYNPTFANAGLIFTLITDAANASIKDKFEG